LWEVFAKKAGDPVGMACAVPVPPPCFRSAKAGSEVVSMTNVELFNALLAVASIVLTVYFGMRQK